MTVKKIGTNGVVFETFDCEFCLILNKGKPRRTYLVGREPIPSEKRNAIKKLYAILAKT